MFYYLKRERNLGMQLNFRNKEWCEEGAVMKNVHTNFGVSVIN